jgi:hypothetical protein
MDGAVGEAHVQRGVLPGPCGYSEVGKHPNQMTEALLGWDAAVCSAANSATHGRGILII